MSPSMPIPEREMSFMRPVDKVPLEPHLVENFFCCLKAFRRIATRYEKTDKCFAAIINLVASVLWIR
jgi:hypothetical protein